MASKGEPSEDPVPQDQEEEDVDEQPGEAEREGEEDEEDSYNPGERKALKDQIELDKVKSTTFVSKAFISLFVHEL